MTFTPTDEQSNAATLARTGSDLVIEALAGTGKTSTLRYIADVLDDRSIQYVAFNKAIVAEATQKFPGNVRCNTAHSLAYRAVGWRYKTRLNGERMRSDQMARTLGADEMVVTVEGVSKRLAPGFLAGKARQLVDVFARSADVELADFHMPTIEGIDVPTIGEDGQTRHRGPNNRAVAKYVLTLAERYWQDVLSERGRLPFSPNFYMKIWHLEGPHIDSEVIMYDEGQDANGCMLAIVEAQSAHAQLIFVGDSYQQIYGWNGAVNSLALAPSDLRAWLTQSFRFGPAIAAVANRALGDLGAPVEVRGTESIPSTVGPVAEPDVILTRTNACAVSTALRLLRDGRKVAIVGGADEVIDFAKGAEALMEGRRSWHRDLTCFDTWGEVQHYVEFDALGGDLKLMVDLVDEFGVDAIVDGLGACIPERYADVVLSTAHKAKGREWSSVRIADDFPDPAVRPPADEEVRLLYVAVTRAMHRLDIEGVAYFQNDGPAEPEDDDEDSDEFFGPVPL
jgi:hypothetical protein